MGHLVSENLLSKKQFGFISGRSTTTQLLIYLNKCIDKIVEGKIVDSIYLDFAKAFDSVPHKRLLQKLKAYGITGKLLKWIEEFLSNRTQTVLVDGVRSAEASVLSGIPQGSVLGPVLFIIYINDIMISMISTISNQMDFYLPTTRKYFMKLLRKKTLISSRLTLIS